MGIPLLQFSGDFSRAHGDAWMWSIRMKKSAKKNARVKRKPYILSLQRETGNTRRNMSFYPREDVTSKNFTSSLRSFN